MTQFLKYGITIIIDFFFVMGCYRSIGDQSPYPNYVIAVPTALQQTILQAVHDNPFAGHLGISRTEERVRKRF